MEGELNAALELSAAEKTGLERQFSLQTVSGQGRASFVRITR